jgi:hypothetical protein
MSPSARLIRGGGLFHGRVFSGRGPGERSLREPGPLLVVTIGFSSLALDAVRVNTGGRLVDHERRANLLVCSGPAPVRSDEFPTGGRTTMADDPVRCRNVVAATGPASSRSTLASTVWSGFVPGLERSSRRLAIAVVEQPDALDVELELGARTRSPSASTR